MQVRELVVPMRLLTRLTTAPRLRWGSNWLPNVSAAWLKSWPVTSLKAFSRDSPYDEVTVTLAKWAPPMPLVAESAGVLT